MDKISKHSLGTTRYVEAPAHYDASQITHADAQNDGQIRCLTDIADVARRLGDDVPSGLTRRAAEEWIEGAISGGAVSLNEATHADLVEYLTQDEEQERRQHIREMAVGDLLAGR